MKQSRDPCPGAGHDLGSARSEIPGGEAFSRKSGKYGCQRFRFLLRSPGEVREAAFEEAPWTSAVSEASPPSGSGLGTLGLRCLLLGFLADSQQMRSHREWWGHATSVGVGVGVNLGAVAQDLGHLRALTELFGASDTPTRRISIASRIVLGVNDMMCLCVKC